MNKKSICAISGYFLICLSLAPVSASAMSEAEFTACDQEQLKAIGLDKAVSDGDGILSQESQMQIEQAIKKTVSDAKSCDEGISALKLRLAKLDNAFVKLHKLDMNQDDANACYLQNAEFMALLKSTEALSQKVLGRSLGISIDQPQTSLGEFAFGDCQHRVATATAAVKSLKDPLTELDNALNDFTKAGSAK